MTNTNLKNRVNELMDGIEENAFEDIHDSDIDETFEGLHEEKWPWSDFQSLSIEQKSRLRSLFPKETANLND